MGLSILLFIADIVFSDATSRPSLLSWISFPVDCVVAYVAVKQLVAMRYTSKRAVAIYREIIGVLHGIGFKKNGFIGTSTKDGGAVVVHFTRILGYGFYAVWHIEISEDGTMTQASYEFPAGYRGLVPRRVEVVASYLNEDSVLLGTFTSAPSLFSRRGPRALAYADEYDLATVRAWMESIKTDRPDISYI